MSREETNSKFEDAFIEALSRQQDHLTKLNLSVGELILDEIIENDTLKPLPIIGTVYGLYKTGKNISERFFLKKVLKFFTAAGRFTNAKKQRFITKMS